MEIKIKGINMPFSKEIVQRSLDFIEVVTHKMAFTYTWFINPSLRKNISIKRVIKHDTRKAIDILLIGDNLATKKHRKEEGHHNFISQADLWEAIWECANIVDVLLLQKNK